MMFDPALAYTSLFSRYSLFSMKTLTANSSITAIPVLLYSSSRILNLPLNTTTNPDWLMRLIRSFGEKNRAMANARLTGNSQMTKHQRQLHRDLLFSGGSIGDSILYVMICLYYLLSFSLGNILLYSQ